MVADLQFFAAYHGGKIAELGDLVDNISAWLLFMLEFQGVDAILVKKIHLTNMLLDHRRT